MINFSRWPGFLTKTADSIVLPLPIIYCTVSVSVSTLPVFHTSSKVTLVFCSILHRFNAVTMLHVILPVTSILCTTCCRIYSKTICSFVKPGSCILISRRVLESTFTVSLIILPFSIEACFILPYHQTFAKSHTSFPLTDINCSWRVIVSASDKRCNWIELILRQSFFSLWLIEVQSKIEIALFFFIFFSLNETSYNGLDSYYSHSKIHWWFRFTFFSHRRHWWLCGYVTFYNVYFITIKLLITTAIAYLACTHILEFLIIL